MGVSDRQLLGKEEHDHLRSTKDSERGMKGGGVENSSPCGSVVQW